MQKANEIRDHISAIEQTQKITSAMEMISSNRMRQVMGHIEYNNSYFTYIRRSMKELLLSSHDITHPFLDERENPKKTYIVVSGDKGFCGAYNSDVLNFAHKILEENPGSYLITLGNVANAYFRSHGINPDINLYGIVQDPTLSRARKAAVEFTEEFRSGTTDEINMIYTSFYGETKKQPVLSRLLPVLLPDFEDIREAHTIEDILYHPSAQEVFDLLIPQYITGYVFGVMVQAYASEHFARMTAMRSATTNARDMIDNLKTQYNLVRQSAITNELAEIADAAEILRGDT